MTRHGTGGRQLLTYCRPPVSPNLPTRPSPRYWVQAAPQPSLSRLLMKVASSPCLSACQFASMPNPYLRAFRVRALIGLLLGADAQLV